jgi:hypothetical protein
LYFLRVGCGPCTFCEWAAALVLLASGLPPLYLLRVVFLACRVVVVRECNGPCRPLRLICRRTLPVGLRVRRVRPPLRVPGFGPGRELEDIHEATSTPPQTRGQRLPKAPGAPERNVPKARPTRQRLLLMVVHIAYSLLIALRHGYEYPPACLAATGGEDPNPLLGLA